MIIKIFKQLGVNEVLLRLSFQVRMYPYTELHLGEAKNNVENLIMVFSCMVHVCF